MKDDFFGSDYDDDDEIIDAAESGSAEPIMENMEPDDEVIDAEPDWGDDSNEIIDTAELNNKDEEKESLFCEDEFESGKELALPEDETEIEEPYEFPEDRLDASENEKEEESDSLDDFTLSQDDELEADENASPAFAPYILGDWGDITETEQSEETQKNEESDNFAFMEIHSEEPNFPEQAIDCTVTTAVVSEASPFSSEASVEEIAAEENAESFVQEAAVIEEGTAEAMTPVEISSVDDPSENTSEESDKDAKKQDRSVSSDLIRGHINTIILRSLYDGDKYGYEIITEIKRKSHDQYSLKEPSLYSALKRLEKDGYVTSYWGGSVAGGRRKYFSLTDDGKEISERNQMEWEYSRTVIDSLISDRDYDFGMPAPSAVDMRVLKRSTSRVPGRENEENEYDYDEPSESYEVNTETTETYTEQFVQMNSQEKIVSERAAFEAERAQFEEILRQREEMLRIREEAGTRREQELLEREFALQAEEERREAEAEAEQIRLEEERRRKEEEQELKLEEERRIAEEEQLRRIAEAEESARRQERERIFAELEAEKARTQSEEIEQDPLAEKNAAEQSEHLRYIAEEAVLAESGITEKVARQEDFVAKEAERARLEEEQARLLAEETERARLAEEQARLLAEEQDRRIAEAEEAARLQERERIFAELEEQQARMAAEEAERARLEEEQKRRIAEAEELARQQERERILSALEAERAEAEAARQQAESEALRIQAEAEVARLRAEAEARERHIAKQNDEIERARALALNADKVEQNFRIIRMEPFAQEREQYEERMRKQAEELERIHARELADMERRIHAEDEEKFRQREHAMIHQNYLNLVRGVRGEETPDMYSSYYYGEPENQGMEPYGAKPEKEREYRSTIQRLFFSTIREEEQTAPSPQQPAPVSQQPLYNAPMSVATAAPAPEKSGVTEKATLETKKSEKEPIRKSRSARTLDGIDFYDLETRAAQDGIRITLSGGGKTKDLSKKSNSLVHKGRALFFSALVVFLLCFAEGSLTLGFRSRFDLPIFYPIFIYGIGFAGLLVAGLLFFNRYGENALRQTGNLMFNVIGPYAICLIVILIVALAQPIDFTSINELMTYVIVPAVFFFNIVVFGIAYYLQIRPRHEE